MIDFDLVAEYEKVIQSFEQSCAAQLQAARLNPTAFPEGAAQGLEAQFQQAREKLLAQRAELATLQRKLVQLESDADTMTKSAQAQKNRIMAYHNAAKTGGFPPDPELEAAPMLTDAAIHAAIFRLLKVHVAAPAQSEDEGSVASAWVDPHEAGQDQLHAKGRSQPGRDPDDLSESGSEAQDDSWGGLLSE